jgi:hypothetical protein
LFLLDLAAADDDNDAVSDDPTNATPPMLLLAITGIHTSNTMLVRLRLGDVNVHALIDSGSMHNLVDEKVANRTGLPMVGCSSATVTMASGERVPFSINDDQFSADFFALPFPGYDVVLGT